jgi:hypothetical protein
VAADPWLAPGDLALRNDIQLLADEGVVRTPVTSWPLSWADVVRDLTAVRSVDLRTPSLQDAYERVRREARRNTRVGVVGRHVEVQAAEHPIRVRGFDDTPREEAEFGGGLDWIGDRFATRLQVRRVLDPDDGKGVRLDGSYVGMVVGNVMISAGYMEKWWGPGWAGSLILSSNARPVPSITVERNYSTPFATPVLKWLGPWRASFQAGRLESARNDVSRPHFMALRIAFKPVRSLEIGLSRSAQLCGKGRDCGLDTYWDTVVGKDAGGDVAKQPGNQLAGFDLRWSLARKVPLALYGQAIGEGESGVLPSRYLGLGGVETWTRARGWSVRAYGEYAKTSCNFARFEPVLGCAYESAIYTDGYRYRSRSIGHAYDRDAAGWTVGAVATRHRMSVSARGYDVKLNEQRSGAQHSLAPAGGKLRGLELSLRTAMKFGTVSVGLGYDDVSGSGVRVKDGFKAYVGWRHAV